MLFSLSNEKRDSVIRGISFHAEPDSAPPVMEYRFLTRLYFTCYGALRDSGRHVFFWAVIESVMLTFEGDTFDTFDEVEVVVVT